MSVTVTQELTQQTVTVTGNPVDNNVTVTVSNARGASGAAGPNSVTSATTSDSTADLLLAAATVSGTLTASHIHGNLAGNVYGHIRAGEALAKGDPVYVSGSHGSGSTLIPIVSKADASNAAKMPAVGIMDAAVANNATGHMVITGTITELATNAYSINAELYVAAGGGMTATPPTARAQPVARVERSNANNGAIIVKVNGLSASDATASTLVRRDSAGNASFGALDTSGLTVTGGTTFGEESLIQFDALEYYYGDGAASAHRIALGAGTTGATLFGAADAGAARTTLGLATTDSVTFAGVATTGTITATTTHPTASAITATQGIYSSFLGANQSAGAFIGCSVSGAGVGFANASTGSLFPCNASGTLTNGVMNLGRADYRFNNYFGTNGNFSGTLAVTGATTLTGAVTTANFIAGAEMTAPAAPAANGYRIFAEDNGGKTRLMVLFATGAAQQIAIEP